jgi:hypothetical protein
MNINKPEGEDISAQKSWKVIFLFSQTWQKVGNIMETSEKYFKRHVLRISTHRAQKVHCCDNCDHTIFPWDLYEKKVVTYQWNIFEFKIHAHPWCEYDPNDGKDNESISWESEFKLVA